MSTDKLREEIKELLDKWNKSILEKDAPAAARLRVDNYSVALPDGATLTKEEEIAIIASADYNVESISVRNLEIHGRESEATAVLENLIKGEFFGETVNALYKFTISLRKTDAGWRATSSRLAIEEPAERQPTGGAPGERPGRGGEFSAPGSGSTFRLRNLVPKAVRSRLREKLKSIVSEKTPSFQELAYIPYQPGQDFVIPPNRVEDVDAGGSELPIPPKELWLGYSYPVHGKAHVSKMLEIVYASDFSFKKNDRILDFGCGAGRMIRHLKDLSKTCEIWGVDIRAEHIYWCKQHLSPPFNFAATTKIPHLPFEDRSFHLIYCGSVFTHIDDLADAWLLELQRILAPGGRLYLTVHDNHTIELFEGALYGSVKIVRQIKSHEIYQKSKDSFAMFTVGRDNNSQVFYDTGYFSKTLRPMFDIVSVNQEAYFYQTAFLLKRKLTKDA